MPKKPRNRYAKRKPYSKGELNRMTDAVIHQLFKEKQGLRFLDGAIHFAIERNPKTSAKKFLKYNLPELIKELLKKL